MIEKVILSCALVLGLAACDRSTKEVQLPDKKPAVGPGGLQGGNGTPGGNTADNGTPGTNTSGNSTPGGGTPSNGNGTPNSGNGTPNGSNGTPNGSNGTPNGSNGTPNGSNGTPVVTNSQTGTTGVSISTDIGPGTNTQLPPNGQNGQLPQPNFNGWNGLSFLGNDKFDILPVN